MFGIKNCIAIKKTNAPVVRSPTELPKIDDENFGKTKQKINKNKRIVT